MLTAVDKKILEKVADMHGEPKGAFNIRRNGQGISRNSTENIEILPKKDKPGIDIMVKPGTVGESVHIPVILSNGMEDMVYNTFDIGAQSDVTIVAGCGIHNSSGKTAQHDGIHQFIVRKGAKMKYVEKHYGEGDGSQRILNPKTIIEVEEGGIAEIDMIQLEGVDQTVRDTEVVLHGNARLVVSEKLLTTASQSAESNISVKLMGEDSTAQILSRSVAKDSSKQIFHLNMHGHATCKGHIQCDSIIMDEAEVAAIPEIRAFHSDAQLIHEAAIGRIASEQLTKLMTLGLTESEAEDMILQGFLDMGDN